MRSLSKPSQMVKVTESWWTAHGAGRAGQELVIKIIMLNIYKFTQISFYQSNLIASGKICGTLDIFEQNQPANCSLGVLFVLLEHWLSGQYKTRSKIQIGRPCPQGNKGEAGVEAVEHW